MNKEKRHFKKIGLLVLNENRTEFLVCEKFPTDMTTDYIMPGGQIENESEVDCIKREIREELDCDVDLNSVKYVGEYDGPAAGGGTLDMKLYEGKLIGDPKPSQEIRRLHWIGLKDQANPNVSEFVRTKIFPDLINKNLLVRI